MTDQPGDQDSDTDTSKQQVCRHRTWKARLCAMGVGLSFALILAEVSLRLIGWGSPILNQEDHLLGVSQVPGASGWQTSEGEAYVRINANGMRDDREITRARPKGVFRIAVLGDSYMQAIQVDYKDSFCVLLEKHLQKAADAKGDKLDIQILNFGCSGYGTAQEFLLLENRVWEYEPDMVLLAFLTGNDISDNHPLLDNSGCSPYISFDPKGNPVSDTSFLRSPRFKTRSAWYTDLLVALSGYSRLLQAGNRARIVLRNRGSMAWNANDDSIQGPVYREPSTPSWVAAWKWTEGLLALMGKRCAVRDVPFGVFVLSNPEQVEPRLEKRDSYRKKYNIDDWFLPDKRIAEVCRSAGVPCLLLAPVLQAIADKESVFFHGFPANPGSGHWNQKGHAVASELIASWIPAEFF